MSEYKDKLNKLDEWQQAALRKARELDDKLGISSNVEKGAKRAQDAARSAQDVAEGALRYGADTARAGFDSIADGAERAFVAADNLDSDLEMGDFARKASHEAARRARDVTDTVMGAAGTAGERADQVFEAARRYYERAGQFYETSSGLTQLAGTISEGAYKTASWVKENPGKTALISFSLVVGVRLGAALPGLDAVLLGTHPHWLTHSALPVIGLRKAGEMFDEYLKGQENLIANGELDQAARARVEFERNVVKYVGAPLLGAFSCAAGAVMIAQIFQPGSIAGAPISWLLGGNPFLDGVWLFANGVICFQQGYKFFSIALADEQQVQKLMREIKGLLPSGAVA
jgi:hypothetical protein